MSTPYLGHKMAAERSRLALSHLRATLYVAENMSDLERTRFERLIKQVSEEVSAMERELNAAVAVSS